jgi:hypothetical protein
MCTCYSRFRKSYHFSQTVWELLSRHAEATSNKAAHGLASGSAERSAAYDDPRWFDARLSEYGEEQCVSSSHFLSLLHMLKPPTFYSLDFHLYN